MRKRFLKFGFITLLFLISSTAAALDFNNFPRQSVVGYFNNDLFLDRVISDPDNDELLIWFGTGTGVDQALSTVPAWSMFSDYFPGNGNLNPAAGMGAPVSTTITRTNLDPGPLALPSSLLGASMAVGDFNGDGLDDLAVGMPLMTVNGQDRAGKVAVIWGGPAFPLVSSLYSQDTIACLGGAEAGDQFGQVLATGDFNCDGYSDLAIGAPLEDLGRISNVGAVHLFYGSIMGLNASKDILMESHIPRERPERKEYFGYALASGRFNAHEICDGLAVGAPGEKINGHEAAGAVFVFYPRMGKKINSWKVDKIHQDSGQVGSSAEDNDFFGSSLGKIVHAKYDGLWIGAEGERSQICSDSNQIFYHRLKANSSGIDVEAGDNTYCGLFPPDLVEKSVGIISEFNTPYGSVAFYFPDSDPSAMELSVLIHGSNADPSRPDPCEANPLIYHKYPAWITEALNANEALIAPEFDNEHFGNLTACLNDPDGDGIDDYNYVTAGGYRGLWGHPIGADDWLNLIVDDLQKVGFETDGKFKLFGHSAGGQFISRYLWRHAERTTRVLIESPSTYLRDKGDGWREGWGAYTGYQHWPGSEYELVIYYPAEMGSPFERWPVIMQTPIIIIVGEDDGLEYDGFGNEEKNDCTRLLRALEWQTELNAGYGKAPGTGKIEFCVYKGGTHHSMTTSDEAASRLLNDLTTGNCITRPEIPSRCLNYTPYPYCFDECPD